jgi:dTDP-4-dehydrorhamnose reductase
MKILVTGGRGMLGTDLCAALDREHEVTAVGSAEMEVTSADAVRACVARERPDWILHCAAYTDVDGCERDPDRAFRVNALGTWHVALASAEQDSALLVISTDFVFDGEKRAPYTEFDAPRPINQYGASKRAGEELALRACPRCTIVRTQWLYGLQGNCFPETILRAAAGYPPERSEGRVRRSLRVVDDQIGAPTFTRDLAAKIAELIGTTKRQDLLPIVHINNAGECSWHEFAVAVLRGSGIDTPVTPIAARDWPSPTRRPAYSVLRRYALELTGKDDMRPWQEALAEYLSERGARK